MHVICITDWPGENWVTEAVNNAQYFVDWFLPFLVFVLAGVSCWHDNPMICNVPCRPGEVADMMTGRFAMSFVSGAKSLTQRREDWLDLHVFVLVERCRRQDEMKNGRNQPPYNTVITYNPKSFHFCACSDLSNCLGKWCGVVSTFVFTRDSLTKWFTFL